MIDPVALEVFGLRIYWYGICYAVGFLFVYYYFMNFYCQDLVDKGRCSAFSREKRESYFILVVLFSLLFARVFHVVFYEFDFYFSYPLEILKFWRGGMSIHGGFFGFLVFSVIFSRKNNLNVWRLSDFFALPVMFFLFVGRIANFINQELYGYVVQSPSLRFLGFRFDRVDGNLRYPTQVFESLKNYVAFLILWYVKFFRRVNCGVLSAWFLIMYNFARFFIDFLRVPEGTGVVLKGLLGISTGQFLCLVFGFVGLVLLSRVR